MQEAQARVIVAILAGGRGARIGGGKPSVSLRGRALIDYPLRAARDAGLPVVVVAKRDSELPEIDAPILREPDDPTHPLCGIVTALDRGGSTLDAVRERPAQPRFANAPTGGSTNALSGGSRVLAVGCDMPFLTGPLLAWFAALTADAAVARLDDGLQPFPAIYSQAHLPVLIEAMRHGRSLRATFRSLGALQLTEAALREFGDPRWLCFSVNGREDLALAARRMDR